MTVTSNVNAPVAVHAAGRFGSILPQIVSILVAVFLAWRLRALAIIMSIPVVVIFLLLQRTLLERMMFGEIP